MNKDRFKPAYGQEGFEWAPKGSEFRVPIEKWHYPQKWPSRLSTAFKTPFNYVTCFNCYAEALWHCPYCNMKFCHQEPCKIIHEASHTIMLLAGDDDGGEFEDE